MSSLVSTVNCFTQQLSSILYSSLWFLSAFNGGWAVLQNSGPYSAEWDQP